MVIYAAKPAYPAVHAWLTSQPPAAVSAVSKVEVLGFLQITPAEEAELLAFLGGVTVLPVADAVIEQAVRLRRQRRMSLGEALIAATALVHALPLATANTRDFSGIPGLTVLDPFAP